MRPDLISRAFAAAPAPTAVPVRSPRTARAGAWLVPLMLAAMLAMLLAGLMLASPVSASPVSASPAQLGPDDLLVTTIPNDFYPAEADLSDCLSALPPPGCGSEAKGGWPQFVVFALIVAGLSVIVARIMVSSRRTRRAQATDDPQLVSRSEQKATEADTS